MKNLLTNIIYGATVVPPGITVHVLRLTHTYTRQVVDPVI